jgi:hypothetical protein
MAGPTFKLHANTIGYWRFSSTPLSRDDALSELKQKERRCPAESTKDLAVRGLNWNQKSHDASYRSCMVVTLSTLFLLRDATSDDII